MHVWDRDLSFLSNYLQKEHTISRISTH
uniref:Uncharacterized protein n=1 Tax=Arundo donax TaxID=35708 RepID=A0A0A9CB47_ARUDO